MKVSSFDVEATVAIGHDRPELLAVARLAADLARPIGAHDLSRELLGALPAVLGQRVLGRCIQLGLLKEVKDSDEASLSEAGRTALEQGEVLAPEEDIWRFFFIDDSLVPAALVHVMRLQGESAQKERATAKAGPRVRGDEPPELLRACEAAAPRPSIQNGHLFQLLRIAELGERGPTNELTLTLVWDTEPSLRVTGQLPASDDDKREKRVDADLPIPAVLAHWSYEQLWRALVTHATRVPRHELEHWHSVAGKPVVPVSFSSLSPVARRTFRHDVKVPDVRFSDIGRFDSTQLSDLDLVPATEHDAQEWLTWLQWEEISDYVTPGILREQASAQRARFPHHSPRARRETELLEQALATRSERARFLLGPADLGLWGDL